MSLLEKLEAEATSLPKNQRLKLAHKLIASVEEIWEEGVDEAWENEIQSRITDLTEGSVQGIPASEVFARVKAIAPDDEL